MEINLANFTSLILAFASLLNFCVSKNYNQWTSTSSTVSSTVPFDGRHALDHEAAQSNVLISRGCDEIEAIFAKSKSQACRCFDGVPDFDNLNLNMEYSYADSLANGTAVSSDSAVLAHLGLNQTDHPDRKSLFGRIWIGCTKSNFPGINQDMISLPDGVVLSKLWIWDNVIALMIPTMFSKVKTEKLIFEHNRLFELSQGRQALKTTAAYLRHLILRNNVIRSVKSDIFQDLTNLRTLDLSYNTITSLDGDSLGNAMSLLRYLSFEHNRISSLRGAVFSGLPHLENLNLASNRLQDLGDKSAFSGLKNLRFLNLANNRLTSLPDWLFSRTPNLHVLNLGNNSLKVVTPNFGQLGHLKRLYLNNNFITVFPKIDLPNLQVLNMDSNLIEKFSPAWSTSLGSLQLLLASNRLSTVLERQLFEGLTKLSVLSLQNNSLSVVKDEAFGEMKNLQKLLLSDNKFYRLQPGSFKGLEKLTTLHLAGNNLQESLEVDILAGLNNLRRLYLNKNQLRIFDSDFLNALLSVKYVNLADNPWQCDCNTVNFSAWIASNVEKLVNFENIICQLPDRSTIAVSDFYSSEPVKQICFGKSSTSGQSDLKDHGPSDIRKISHSTPGTNSTWITVLAFVLAISSVLFLLALVYLFLSGTSTLKKNSLTESFESNLNANKINSVNCGKLNGHFLRRIPSDVVHLISKKSSPVTAPLLINKIDEK